jgi:hypothetical protein
MTGTATTRTKTMPTVRTVSGEVLAPTPPRINLSTIDDVRLEMARVYRDMRSKGIDPQDGTRLTYVLAQLGKMHELADVEKRVIALERVLKQRKRK